MCYLSCLPCHAWTGVGRCCVGVQASPAPAPVAHWLLTLLVLELSSPMGTSAFQWAVWAPHISRSCSRCLKRGCRPPSNCGGRRQLPARRELRCSERLHAVGQSTDAEAGCASNNNGAEAGCARNSGCQRRHRTRCREVWQGAWPQQGGGACWCRRPRWRRPERRRSNFASGLHTRQGAPRRFDH